MIVLEPTHTQTFRVDMLLWPVSMFGDSIAEHIITEQIINLLAEPIPSAYRAMQPSRWMDVARGVSLLLSSQPPAVITAMKHDGDIFQVDFISCFPLETKLPSG